MKEQIFQKQLLVLASRHCPPCRWRVQPIARTLLLFVLAQLELAFELLEANRNPSFSLLILPMVTRRPRKTIRSHILNGKKQVAPASTRTSGLLNQLPEHLLRLCWMQAAC